MCDARGSTMRNSSTSGTFQMSTFSSYPGMRASLRIHVMLSDQNILKLEALLRPGPLGLGRHKGIAVGEPPVSTFLDAVVEIVHCRHGIGVAQHQPQCVRN